LKKKNRRITKT